jgi:hypothetical protein
MAASAPPAIIMSASFLRMISRASPIAWLAVAQAVTTERLGPFRPYSMEKYPDNMFGMIAGIRNGVTRLCPRASRVRCSLVMVAIAPMPVPRITPKRSATLETSTPQSSKACLAAACPKIW